MNCFDLNLNINSLHLRYMSLEQTYNLTFTAGALLMNETCAVAEVFVESGYNWEITKERAFKENLMEKEKVTGEQFAEIMSGKAPEETTEAPVSESEAPAETPETSEKE